MYCILVHLKNTSQPEWQGCLCRLFYLITIRSHRVRVASSAYATFPTVLCSITLCLVPHPRLFGIAPAYMFMYKKKVLDETGELIQWYLPLEDVCTYQLEKGSVHQDS